MAMSPAEIEAFIEALQQDAALRDRVRGAILADDFLALPGIVRSLGEKLDRLTDRVDGIAIQLDRLTGEVSKLSGDTGNLKGRFYEFDYERHLSAHVGRRFHRAQLLPMSDYQPFYDAWSRGDITEDEWQDAARLAVIALAQDWHAPEKPEVVLAMELSIVVDEDDVIRAQRRAQILAKSGAGVMPIVDGDAILPEARTMAERLGVLALVSREGRRT